MKFTVLTMWHNEAPLAGLFMRHYLAQGAAAIHVIVDRDTSDAGPAIARRYCARLHRGPETAGMDDLAKVAALNALAATITDGYILVADADEFAYSTEGPGGARLSIAEHLELHPAKWYGVRYWQAFRHVSEGPLDTRPVLEQRRHGCSLPFGQGHWCKPAIVRADLHPAWKPGHHYVEHDTYGKGGPELAGAHWAMAEPDLAVARRLSRRDRMSQANFQAGLTSHQWHVTEAEIREECQQHENDPIQVE